MSYDPTRITELLTQLQNSSAFQNAVTPSPSLQTPALPPQNPPPGDSLDHLPSDTQSNPALQPTPGPSVFELLSRLNPGAASSGSTIPSRPPATKNSDQKDAVVSRPGPSESPNLDLRYMTVQQALPHISRLVQRVDFREKIKKMQDMQNQLEQSLYSDQQGVMKRHEERIAYAQNRANIIGVPISDQENQGLASQLSEDLKKFHLSRVLVAWDAQRTKQQSQMEALGVPCMFVTSEPAALQRQQKVLRILLESINESEDME
ncbi:hypothetical protein FS749_010490 [Ceratobasidium sp. UAMH 11750]|nr:hypothetical protein FS749_010490 [Ceratobasidium sp. UAMH 11750]